MLTSRICGTDIPKKLYSWLGFLVLVYVNFLHLIRTVQGDFYRQASSSLNGCNFVSYSSLYFYGPQAQRLSDIESAADCAYRCWKFTGIGRCEAANFVMKDKRCELMYRAFNIEDPSMVRYYGDNNPDSIYILSVTCDTDLSCGRTLIDPMTTNLIRSRIVGGTGALPYSIPWIISLRRGFTDTKRHACGGALIRRDDGGKTDIVITAAHCKESDYADNEYVAVAGEFDLHNLGPEESTLEVEKFILHENYNATTSENDIAILKLKKSVTFGQTVQPVCLPKKGERLPDGTTGLIAGWGAVSPDYLEEYQYLQQLIVPIVNIDTCVTDFLTNSKHDDGTPDPKFVDKELMMCAGFQEGGKDSCKGDSGGPLTFKSPKGTYVLHGLVSFGTRCAQRGLPGVYTRVASYIDWIENTVRSL